VLFQFLDHATPPSIPRLNCWPVSPVPQTSRGLAPEAEVVLNQIDTENSPEPDRYSDVEILLLLPLKLIPLAAHVGLLTNVP